MKKLPRILLSLALLWIVWHHAHWSVALCLSLLFLANEGQAVWMSHVNTALKKWKE